MLILICGLLQGNIQVIIEIYSLSLFLFFFFFLLRNFPPLKSRGLVSFAFARQYAGSETSIIHTIEVIERNVSTNNAHQFEFGLNEKKKEKIYLWIVRLAELKTHVAASSPVCLRIDPFGSFHTSIVYSILCLSISQRFLILKMLTKTSIIRSLFCNVSGTL